MIGRIYGGVGQISEYPLVQKDFGAVVVKLEQNYHSSKTIIAGANAIISATSSTR
jgi:superfamily I DNA/RNA helicase